MMGRIPILFQSDRCFIFENYGVKLEDMGVVLEYEEATFDPNIFDKEKLVKEFEDLSLKVEMGTSENPTADKTRLDQIYASVTGITDTLGNLVSFTEDYDEKMDNLNKPGGVYGGGMDPNVNLGLNIFMQKLPGKRVPRFMYSKNTPFL